MKFESKLAEKSISPYQNSLVLFACISCNFKFACLHTQSRNFSHQQLVFRKSLNTTKICSLKQFQAREKINNNHLIAYLMWFFFSAALVHIVIWTFIISRLLLYSTSIVTAITPRSIKLGCKRSRASSTFMLSRCFLTFTHDINGLQLNISRASYSYVWREVERDKNLS